MKILFLLVIAIFLLKVLDRYASSSLKITFLDVGQGDGTLIQFPKGESWLVDGGKPGFYENSPAREIQAELAMRWILKLDRAILTHPDNDHGGGLLSLVDLIPIKKLTLNPDSARDKPALWRELISKAAQRNIHLEKAPLSLNLNRVKVSLIFPSYHKKTNNNSIVLFLAYGKCRVLLTADIEAPTETWLEKHFNFGKIDVLKVAHHGSKTSSYPKWIEKIKPALGVISAGVGNMYRHPHPLTLKTLHQAGTQILRTDFHGAIQVELTQDSMLKCKTWEKSCGEFRCGD